MCHVVLMSTSRRAVSDSVLAIGILCLGLITRFALLNYPRAVVFDEYHFGKFVNGYLTGEYFFDIHPPLGKLVLTLAAHAGGYNGTTMAWAKIGDPIPAAVNLFALRAGPALQGALLLPLLYIAGRAMGLSQPASLLAPAGALFDVCLLVESRLVLTDATLLLGFAVHLAASFSSDHHPPLGRAWTWRIAAAGGGIAMAVCTKWTGAGCLALGGVHSMMALYRGFSGGRRISQVVLEALARLGLLLLLPALCYILCGWLHFALLPLTGPGAKFMTAAFRASLRGENATSLAAAKLGSADPTPLGFVSRFVELNKEMLRANANIKKGHDWSSRWYDWPLMRRSVLYWIGKQSPYIEPPSLPVARIYAIGTPAVWWLAAAAPTLFIGWATTRILAPSTSRAANVSPPASVDEGQDANQQGKGVGDEAEARTWSLLTQGGLLLLGYLANWLPFVAVERAAFIYHFLPSLLHALLLSGVLLDAAIPPTRLLDGRAPVDPRLADALSDELAAPVEGSVVDGVRSPDALRWLVAGALITIMAACFAFFAPLAYGMPMSHADLDTRMWLDTWR